MTFKNPKKASNLFLIIVLGILLALMLAGCGDKKQTNEIEPEIVSTNVEVELIQATEEVPSVARLDPLSIPKYQQPLYIPPLMQPIRQGNLTDDEPGQRQFDDQTLIIPPVSQSANEGKLTSYEIAVRQFEQQILPEGFPPTTVWGYGVEGDPLPSPGVESSFHYPANTIQAQRGEKIRVRWFNDLVDDPESEASRYIPHFLPIDQTIDWAFPDRIPVLDTELYLGPVPIVTHVAGARVYDHSDGSPEGWFLPLASDIPIDYYLEGFMYTTATDPYVDPIDPDNPVLPSSGTAQYEYGNDQPASTLWYHDNAMGISRLNVYAGLSGFWLLRDDIEASLGLPGPSPQPGDPPETNYYDIPLSIQDKSFNEDGSLYYPESRRTYEGYQGAFMPDTNIPARWHPSFFGDTMLVNGNTWPYLEVEPRLYRFRLLNSSNSRFLLLDFDQDLGFTMIGGDGGFLSGKPVELDQVLLAPGERADVIIDFSSFTPGDEIIMLNLGSDRLFTGLPIDSQDSADPETTGQVMKFTVVNLTEAGNPGSIPAKLPVIQPISSSLPERDLTLYEQISDFDGLHYKSSLGTPEDGPKKITDQLTANPDIEDAVLWNLINLTSIAHSLHLHIDQFQIFERVPFDQFGFISAQEDYLSGSASQPPDWEDFVTGEAEKPELWESGWKDTVISPPGYITRVVAMVGYEGQHYWESTILEQRDNEMMYPFYIGELWIKQKEGISR
jgi:FtsP/CotA-like multicopper oxidase with cupredoxin domain